MSTPYKSSAYREQELVAFTRTFYATHRHYPSQREIAAGCGIQASRVRMLLASLIRKNYIHVCPTCYQTTHRLEIVSVRSAKPR